MTAEPIERHWPKQWADEELTLQWEFLTFLRITAVNKIAELDPALAAAAPIKTSPFMTLIGVIKHLTAVEREWFTRVGGGSELPSLWVDDPEFDWRIRPEDTPASVVAAYREEWANAEAALAGKTADDRAVVTVNGRDRTVRWLLSHVIQETARHVGHMDLLRTAQAKASGRWVSRRIAPNMRACHYGAAR